MTDDRVEALSRMLEANPDDPRARFGLALELERQERWEEAADHLRKYLQSTDDEGNAYGRLGHVLRELGREEEARVAYRDGIAAAHRHGHPTMAAEFEEILEDWDD